jgi:hypothetical protein
MAAHEREGRCRGLRWRGRRWRRPRWRATHGDARVLVVCRCLIERANQRRPAGGAHRRTIEPIDVAEGARDVGYRPLPFRRVRERHRCDVAGGVVSRHHTIARAVPPVVSGGVGRGHAALDPTPPSRVVHLEWVELHGVVASGLGRAGHAERHRGLAIHRGQREAALIELQPLQHRRGSAVPLAQLAPDADDRVARRLVNPAPGFGEAAALGHAKHVRHHTLLAGPQIQHAPAAGVPGSVHGQIEVDVILE